MMKSFTALAILKLRDEGKLSPEDPVSRWIPKFARMELPTRDSPPLRVRQLLSHSAVGLGPDEWLVVGPPSSCAAVLESLARAVGREDGAAVDVSSSRVLLELQGPLGREVLASCCSIDLHPRVFGPGHCAQTLLAKAPVLLAQVDQAPTFRLFVRPSYVSYVVSWLIDGMEGVRAESARS